MSTSSGAKAPRPPSTVWARESGSTASTSTKRRCSAIGAPPPPRESVRATRELPAQPRSTRRPPAPSSSMSTAWRVKTMESFGSTLKTLETPPASTPWPSGAREMPRESLSAAHSSALRRNRENPRPALCLKTTSTTSSTRNVPRGWSATATTSLPGLLTAA